MVDRWNEMMVALYTMVVREGFGGEPLPLSRRVGAGTYHAGAAPIPAARVIHGAPGYDEPEPTVPVLHVRRAARDQR